MKTNRFTRLMHGIMRNEAGASHLVVGAMLVVTILYATMII